MMWEWMIVGVRGRGGDVIAPTGLNSVLAQTLMREQNRFKIVFVSLC